MNSRYEAPTNLSQPVKDFTADDSDNNDYDYNQVNLPKGAIPMSSEKEQSS